MFRVSVFWELLLFYSILFIDCAYIFNLMLLMEMLGTSSLWKEVG